jgi:hypothetical protein
MAEAATPRRAIVLGASNVMRNLPTVIATARATWGAPLDLLVACGHGRSYGWWNRMLGYSLPGIVACGLWEALDAREPAPTVALVTDVGNDLFYGATPDMIVEWVERCVERLRPRCEQIVLTELPLAPVRRMKPSHYYFLRRVMFPACKLTYDETLAHAHCLNEKIVALAKNFSLAVCAPELAWYGLDPIHIRRKHALVAWPTILRAWSAAELAAAPRASLREAFTARASRVHRQRFWSREFHRVQPAARFADGSTLSLY